MSDRRLEAADALETLVNQFADPMSFLRELVQNAIDAGTPEVEVRISFAAGEGGRGLLNVQIDDWGEGMSAEIIDSKLTRLFSSTKEGDFTKIGKFGIGFVSVFAVKPDLVVVDTSRDGDSWRVIFHADRSFERLAIDAPVDGTKIRLVKEVDADEVEAFTVRAGEVLRYWCKHTRVPIRFQGEAINQPLVVDSPCQVSHSEAGTEVVAGLTVDEQPAFGFYNQGLTLLEGRAVHFGAVTFKISSRYLEHTLTRDNVLRDESYAKAMALVGRLAREALPARLFELLANAGAAEPAEEHAQLYQLLAAWLRLGNDTVEARLRPFAERPAFVAVDGQAVTVRRCLEANGEGELFYGAAGEPVSAALVARGALVVRGVAGSAVVRALEALPGKGPVRAAARYCVALPGPAVEERWRLLTGALVTVMRDAGYKVRELRVGHLDYPGSEVRGRLAVTQRDWGEVTAIAEAALLGDGLLARERVVVLNADHRDFAPLVALARREPELAAYLAAKDLLLRQELTPEIDTRLAEAAWERRCRRSTR